MSEDINFFQRPEGLGEGNVEQAAHGDFAQAAHNLVVVEQRYMQTLAVYNQAAEADREEANYEVYEAYLVYQQAWEIYQEAAEADYEAALEAGQNEAPDEDEDINFSEVAASALSGTYPAMWEV